LRHRIQGLASSPIAGAIDGHGTRCLDLGVLSSILLHDQIATLVRRVKPRVVVATYEGHGWERLVFHAARQVAPDVLCVGYQHTVLFPRHHAALRRLGPEFDPDLILTTGHLNARRIAVSMPNIRVEVYGTHRAPQDFKLPASDRRPQCLVVPDGVQSECETLFDFAIACSRAMPQLQFVFRTHPILPFATLTQRCRRFAQLPHNVRVSSEVTLEADAETSRWVLYRGSSAVIGSMLSGARPIYLQRHPAELAIDPLYGLTGWRRVVGTRDEFLSIAADDLRSSTAKLLEECQVAVEYSRGLAVSARTEVFGSLVGLATDAGSL